MKIRGCINGCLVVVAVFMLTIAIVATPLFVLVLLPAVFLPSEG